MPRTLIDDVARDPVRDLDECPKTDDRLDVRQHFRVDCHLRVLLVSPHESRTESAPNPADDGPQWAGDREGRLAEQKGRERNVVRARRKYRRAPVEHRHYPIAVDEQIERVQIAVANDGPVFAP